MTHIPSPTCPVCEAEVRLSTLAILSELLVCDSCSSTLEVRSLDPVLLEEAPQEQEDWGE
jgi:alpha-aminoadipate/glutamate carrier protein LysW